MENPAAPPAGSPQPLLSGLGYSCALSPFVPLALARCYPPNQPSQTPKLPFAAPWPISSKTARLSPQPQKFAPDSFPNSLSNALRHAAAAQGRLPIALRQSTRTTSLPAASPSQSPQTPLRCWG